MSGFGPAACWLAHKRLESWSRMAKERVGAVRRVTLDRNSDEIPSTSVNVNDGNTTSIQQQQKQQSIQSMTPPPSASSLTSNTSGIGSASDSCDIPTDSEQEVKLMKESQAIQSANSAITSNVNVDVLRGTGDILHNSLHLQHQGRPVPPKLQRTPSISSQSSIDSVPSRQLCQRNTSTQIRTFGPDGRSSLSSEPILPTQFLSRTTSPSRTISLDTRNATQEIVEVNDLRASSSSQTSPPPCLASGTTNLTKLGNRSISPLLIPPPRFPISADLTLGPASPLGAIQPDLYRGPNGPLYLTAPGSSSPFGKLHLCVKYDYQLFDLTVHLIEGYHSTQWGGFRDPYVRLYLQPEVDNRKRQTVIHRGESNPYFDQHFKFPVSRDQLQGKQLILQVLDYDRYSYNDTIGEVRIYIDQLDLSKSVEIWGDLVRTKKPAEDRPELLCSLNYLPQAERLTVVIMKAKNLDTIQETFVKIYLIQNGKRMKKKKTTVSKSDDAVNPIWNEAFTFNLQPSCLQQTAIEIYVINAGSGGGSGESQEMGSIGLGPQETGTGCQHWHDMINNARKPTAMWHFIR